MRERTEIPTAAAFAFATALAGLAAPSAAQAPWVGLSSLRSTLFVERTQEGFGPGLNDLFGFAFVAADFSGDGVDELVTGIPGDDCSPTETDCGAVFLSWGNPGAGLIDQGGFLWAGAEGSPATAREGDKYGRALAAGDFNHDGLADLVIGAPAGNLFAEPGTAQIHYGLPGAIQVVPEHLLEPGVGGVPDSGIDDFFRNARFGAAFATGDFNGDGHDDLAIGAPEWSFDNTGIFRAGVVFVAHGHIGGLVPYEGFGISQREEGIPDDAESNDHFGAALAAGDFNGDGFDDLVVGVPNEDGVGAMLILYGSPNSLIFANHYWLGEFDLGSTGAAGDRFGESLETGDFNGDGFDDLAVGVSGQDGGDGDFDIGMVGVLYGAPGSALSEPPGGFNFSATQWWWEELIGQVSDGNDLFGYSLAAADLNGDGYDELAIGAPGELIFGQQHGEVLVMPGSASRLSAPAGPFSAGIRGLPAPAIAQVNYGFGESLAAGDFDGNGFADLVIGMPKLQVGDLADAGGEIVLYGSLFSDGFEAGDADLWSSVTP